MPTVRPQPKLKMRLNLPRSLAAVAAEPLEKEIIEGRLRPGERLVEQEWAAELGISRGSFREVLRILATAGLVEILPRRGARVATISKKDVEEIYFLRKHLMSVAAAEAATNMTDARLETFRKVLRKMEEAARRTDLSSYFRWNVVFHETILEVAGIDRLRDVVHYLGKPTLRYRFLGLQLPGRMLLSLKAHQETVSALARRDGPDASKAIFRMIEGAGEAITRELFGAESHDAPDARLESAPSRDTTWGKLR